MQIKYFLNKICLVILSFLFLFLVSCDINFVLVEETEEVTNKETETIDNKTVNTETDDIYINPVSLTIYALNDFHGVLFENSKYAGISKLGEYITSNKNDGTIVVSSGDMFQGTAVSSMTRGRSVVDCMNYIGFDAMAIGNHEFDWGIDVVMKYQDGNLDNGEASFPFLCCNCTDLNTNELASWCKPYTVIERLGVKIGLIGVIGSDEESSITPSFVEGYDFTDEVVAIKKYTKILREDEGCNLVFILCHLDTSSINQKLVSFTGEYRIDAIFNGHTHQAYYGDYKRDDGSVVPYIQSGCYGAYLGKINIMYDRDQDKVIGASSMNYNALSKCKNESDDINNILTNYQEYIDIANQELGKTGITITRDIGGVWAATVLKEFGEGDVGICNVGGIRSNAFPMAKDSMINYDNIFAMMPFENTIVKCELLGSDLIRFFSNSYYVSDNVDTVNYTINGESIDRSKYYTVVTIDYLYEKSYLPFLNYGKNPVKYDVLFREALVSAFKENVYENGKFIR